MDGNRHILVMLSGDGGRGRGSEVDGGEMIGTTEYELCVVGLVVK